MTNWRAFQSGWHEFFLMAGTAPAAFLVFTVFQMRRERGVEHPDFPLRLFRRRLMPMLIGYGMVILTGVSLLVRTAKIRRQAEGRSAH